jgi:hypothetical protein
MNKNRHPHYGRSHVKKLPNTSRPKVSVLERRARKARKQLLKLFPHLAACLHKGVSAASIYQHAISLAQTDTSPQAVRTSAT